MLDFQPWAEKPLYAFEVTLTARLEQRGALAVDEVEVQETRGCPGDDFPELRLPFHKGQLLEIHTIQSGQIEGVEVHLVEEVGVVEGDGELDEGHGGELG